MRPSHAFTVTSAVPEMLRPIETIAHNLHWVWDRQLAALFDRLDGTVDGRSWRDTGQHPVDLVRRTSPRRWEELATDEQYVEEVQSAAARLDELLTRRSWFDARREAGSPLGLVAYFSPEFGITEALPQYSGGLGVLAGDHLKASSDLGIPLVGVGLLYTEGYFHQQLDPTGWQLEHNDVVDPRALGLRPTGVRVSVDLAGVEAAIDVWRVDVGRITLYLLDTNVEGNPPEIAAVTDRLYGGDRLHRLRQEIVLGIGGVRALRALGSAPTVFHMNEGHAGFLGLERVREWTEAGLSFDEAVEAVRAGTVFTTHTPVPAGIDRFPLSMFEEYFGSFAVACGVDLAKIVELGQAPGSDGDGDGEFNMALMGLRLGARRNGVARLHGAVSRAMFGGLWADLPTGDVPIGHVTNGVHARSWVGGRVDELLTRQLGDDWHLADADRWQGVHDIPAWEIWDARCAGRRELVEEVRRRHGDGLLDPDVLTIGFARRFATYKRATLLLSDPDRLRALLLHPDRPMQFVFAGKAHPADIPGKELIRRIHEFASDAGVRHRFVFLPDYDIGIARTMYHGCDVWLNTPRRPMEACGTSGMKAALNGVLNCSIRDGWWDEMSTGDNGWDIPSFDHDHDPDRRDRREATAAFELLEHQVAPLFYATESGVPRGWVGRVATNWSTLGWNVTAGRMVRDYVSALYEPAAEAARRVAADEGAVARSLAAWRTRIETAWSQVEVHTDPASDLDDGFAGVPRRIVAQVSPGRVGADDLVVQVIHGPVRRDGTFDEERLAVVQMSPAADGRFEATFAPSAAGPWGASVRVLPVHPALGSPYETGLVTSG